MPDSTSPYVFGDAARGIVLTLADVADLENIRYNEKFMSLESDLTVD